MYSVFTRDCVTRVCHLPSDASLLTGVPKQVFWKRARRDAPARKALQVGEGAHAEVGGHGEEGAHEQAANGEVSLHEEVRANGEVNAYEEDVAHAEALHEEVSAHGEERMHARSDQSQGSRHSARKQSAPLPAMIQCCPLNPTSSSVQWDLTARQLEVYVLPIYFCCVVEILIRLGWP